MYYNPAALGLLGGVHLYLDGSAQIELGEGRRANVDSRTGAASTGFATPQRFRTMRPNFYFGAVADPGLETVVLGLAVHTPVFNSRSLAENTLSDTFDGALQGPGRYHGVELSLFQIHTTLAAAYKITRNWSIGVAITYAFSDIDFAFVRDVALDGGSTRDADEFVALDDCGSGTRCDYGSGRAAESIRIQGNTSGIGFAAGISGRVHPRVTIGAGFVSAISAIGRGDLTHEGRAFVRRSTATTENATSLSPLREASGRGTVTFEIPDIINAGVTWNVRDQLQLNFQLRLMTYRRHDQLAVQLSGRQLLRRPEVPERMIHFRGFQATYGAQLGARWRFAERWQLIGAAMIESGAVPAESTTELAIDALKVDALIAMRWNAIYGLWVRLGYGFIAMPSVSVTNGSFDPTHVVRCADGGFNAESEACSAAIAGKGLASNAGEYALFTQRLSLAVGYDW